MEGLRKGLKGLDHLQGGGLCCGKLEGLKGERESMQMRRAAGKGGAAGKG